MTIPIDGEAVRSLIEYKRMASVPGDEPLWVYVDGEHVATRTLSNADFDGDPALVEPETTIEFDSRGGAVSTYAALVHPTSSVLWFVTSCD